MPCHAMPCLHGPTVCCHPMVRSICSICEPCVQADHPEFKSMMQVLNISRYEGELLGGSTSTAAWQPAPSNVTLPSLHPLASVVLVCMATSFPA